MQSSLCNQRWSHIKKRSILKKCALWKCWSELSEKGYYTDVMIHDSCVTHLGKYDINTTLCIIDTGNKAFIYPIFQLIKQSSILRSSCCMTRVEARSELLTDVKTNDVCAQYYNNRFIMHCYYLKWSHIIPWTEQSLQYFIGWACQGKVLKWSVKLQHIKQVELSSPVHNAVTTTSVKEIWSELGFKTLILPV